MIQAELQALSSPEKTKTSAWFFKTGKGQYGEGDVFIGVTVPEQWKIAKKYYKSTDFEQVSVLLMGKIHEYRLTALMILLLQYQKNKDEKIVKFYLNNLKCVNNWDLVDSSARKILGISKQRLTKTFLALKYAGF